VKEKYNEWMLGNNHAFTATGKIKRPSYSTVATWVKESWDDVSSDLIKKSFKCCGVSTKLDGSEDDQLFDYDKVVDSDEEIEEDSEGDEYPEEDYKNDWNIMNRARENFDEVDDGDGEVDDENGESSVGNRRKEKGKGKEKEKETEDEYQEEISSDDEDIRRISVKLKKKYKRKNY
jgi:hypothetical protein